MGSFSGYRATERHWRSVDTSARRHGSAGLSCILELRARIEALEATQQPAPATELAHVRQQLADLRESIGAADESE